jgi:tetraacyldisaccharide 4'-kinase
MPEHGAQAPGPPSAPLPGLVGAVSSRGYGWLMARRNRRFDAGRGVVRFDRPVISIGNLSVGGTGKTPMVMHVLEVLLAAGHRPCIAMRGYRSSGGESDEAEEYRRRFPGVPVVAQPDRTHGLIKQFYDEYESDEPHSDCIVLDDGFQHRKIGREMDVVLVDASRSPFADRLLPAGWLREPVESLKRATHVVITHAESVGAGEIRELEESLAKAAERAVTAVTRHGWSPVLRAHSPAGEREVGREALGGRGFAVCAIGQPGPFLSSARELSGGSLAGQVVLRDHDPFRPATVERIIQQAQGVRAAWIVTTSKDWSKLRQVPVERWPCPVVVPELELQFDRGEAELDAAVLETILRGVPDDE